MQKKANKILNYPIYADNIISQGNLITQKANFGHLLCGIIKRLKRSIIVRIKILLPVCSTYA